VESSIVIGYKIELCYSVIHKGELEVSREDLCITEEAWSLLTLEEKRREARDYVDNWVYSSLGYSLESAN
jgi:hypothetical protein